MPSIEHRPQGKTPPAILFQAKIHLHMLDAGREHLGLYRRQIGGAEIALELVIEIHEEGLWAARTVGKRERSIRRS